MERHKYSYITEKFAQAVGSLATGSGKKQLLVNILIVSYEISY